MSRRSASARAVQAGELEVGGRRLTIRHIDRVVFPWTGTTKAQLLTYYVAVSEVMLPHLRDRLLHMHRAKIDYCVVNELAALLWAVNLGSIELHTSLHLTRDLHRPTVIAFDLDPGDGRGILEIALRLRELFAPVLSERRELKAV